MKRFWVKLVSTIFFTGYIPFAPGTFGTIWGIPALYGLKILSFKVQIIILISVFLISAFFAAQSVLIANHPDPSWIVIDEFCGYIAGGLFIVPSFKYLILHFIIFRIFDILKPFPVNIVERRIKGGIGVVLDDVVAGVMSGIIVLVFTKIF